MVQKTDENCQDGADEKMLNGDQEKEELTEKGVEVKFIGEQNGDAKIEIQANAEDKMFSGLTKEELMKFANDPFWIKMRWFMFILFWLLWVAMLVGAILIIINSPKCAAPVPLVWWKQGPLITLESDQVEGQIENIVKFGGKGVVYELSSDETYLVTNMEVENKIKNMVSLFGAKDINLILDITPNYVTKHDDLFIKALSDENARGAFVWSATEEPWRVSNSWKEVSPGNFVIGQHGEDRYELVMGNEAVKEKFLGVLDHLTELGVKGFRLKGYENLIVSGDLKNNGSNFQDGLGELLHSLSRYVHNATSGEGFLSIASVLQNPDKIKVHDTVMSIDLPQTGNVSMILKEDTSSSAAKSLLNELKNVNAIAGSSTWVQWAYSSDYFRNLAGSEYNIFMMLLPGVPVVPLQALNYGNSSHTLIDQLERYRSQASYMHGSFEMFNDTTGTVIGYTRIKAGNPGYFVALNPTETEVSADFSLAEDIAPELTVVLMSDHYSIPDVSLKSKLSSTAVKLSPKSALVLTYVPK